jgi:smoothened protein
MPDSNGSSNLPVCPELLIKTADSLRTFPGFPNCALKCGDPFFSENDHVQFSVVMLSLIIICIVCNIFGMASLLLKLRMVKLAPFNPDKCALLMNLSFLLSSFGYLLPHFPHLRELSTCSEEGARQFLIENTSFVSRNVSMCVVTFFLTFVFTLSGLVWFGHLMFACHLDFQKIINAHKKTKAVLFTLTKSSFVFFYGTAFLIPIIMAVAVIFLQSVSF